MRRSRTFSESSYGPQQSEKDRERRFYRLGLRQQLAKEDLVVRIRHIALYSNDPEKEAAFYRRAFGLKEVRRSERGSVFLSDGYINLALLRSQGGSELRGLHHFGFQVESITAAQERLRQIGPNIEILSPHEGVMFAEYKLKDPDGNPVDISERGWAV